MFEIKLAGENAIIIYFGHSIAPELVHTIAHYRDLLSQALADLIIDAVPSYTSLMISYRTERINHADFCQLVSQLLSNADKPTQELSSNLVEIPVYYDVEVGLDLAEVLTTTQLSLAEFITIHSTPTYLTYAIGFSPVFAFLGMVDQRIQQPRLTTPRISIPAGSVGIADRQTAVYPVASSGGWNIVGRTPLDLSLADISNLERFQAGCSVKFTAIDRQTFIELGGKL